MVRAKKFIKHIDQLQEKLSLVDFMHMLQVHKFMECMSMERIIEKLARTYFNQCFKEINYCNLKCITNQPFQIKQLTIKNLSNLNNLSIILRLVISIIIIILNFNLILINILFTFINVYFNSNF